MTKTSEPTIASYVQLRACPNPNDFFDEIIPDTGLEVGDWRLTIRKIPMPVFDSAGGRTLVDVVWLYAESNSDEAQLARFQKEKLPLFFQIVQALAGIRSMHLSGEVEFSMLSKDFVKDGVSRNIEPYMIEIAPITVNVRITDATGSVVFDSASAYEAEKAERTQRTLQNAKSELQATAQAVAKHLGDAFFRRAWESFQLASGKGEYAIKHLFDVRDAVLGKFGKEEIARSALGIDRIEWSDFGRLFNNGAVIGGRHNGMHPEPLQLMTSAQRGQAMRFAKKLLINYGSYLDNEVALVSKKS